MKVVETVGECFFQIQGFVSFMQERVDQSGASGPEDQGKDHRGGDCDVKLHPDRIRDPFIIPFTIELRSIDPGTRQTSENAEVKDKDQLVGNCDT